MTTVVKCEYNIIGIIQAWFLTDRSKAVGTFVDPFCYLCFLSVMLSYLFLAALWYLLGKG